MEVDVVKFVCTQWIEIVQYVDCENQEWHALPSVLWYEHTRANYSTLGLQPSVGFSLLYQTISFGSILNNSFQAFHTHRFHIIFNILQPSLSHRLALLSCGLDSNILMVVLLTPVLYIWCNHRILWLLINVTILMV